MREVPVTILAIFAHPDDEIGVGSTLAYYSDKGVFTVLACASRGEAATIYCDDCATRENLADVRTHELECACQNLGIAELRWLDWPDGGIAQLPRPRAIGRIVSLIRRYQPDVLITHPENGLYPHPDHLAIWEMVRAAYDAAADLGQYPEAGAPWAVSRLYTRAIPQSYFDAAPEFAAARVELNGQLLPFVPTPDEAVDVTMPVAPWAARRVAAWECHRSQHNPEGAFTKMPEELQRAQAENEYFVRVAARVPPPRGIQDDLLAGLDGGSEGSMADADEPAGEIEPGRPFQQALAVRRGLLAVCEEYRRGGPKADFAALLRRVMEGEQEMIYVLAGALRRLDRPAGSVEPDRRVLNLALTAETAGERARFLRVCAQHAALLYAARAEAATGAEEQPAWAELARLAQAQVDSLKGFGG